MMVRFLRSGKWELIFMFAASSVASLLLGFAAWLGLIKETGLTEARVGAAFVFLLVSAVFGYWAGQRMQRRIDTLQLALKQANNGNYDVQITENGALSFAEAYREFNELAEKMKEKMKQLQMAGEEQVMIATSNEAAVLEERKRLARDLHDTVSQQLFAIHMCASSLPKLQEIDPVRAASVQDQLIQMSTLAQKQMRIFIAQLRPLELEGRTLREALDKWFPDYCRQNGLQGQLDWRIEDDSLSEAKEHQLFLIVQEAMANIVKHAQAQHCSLTLAETERQIVLGLQDDGAGFRVNEVKRGSYGLSTMRERAQKLGGDTEIISKPGSGTRVKVTIPKIGQGANPSDSE
ncbi:sensor histidine kinase [Paenibacillus sp. NPDC058071]|uniref:sensor histidine kinase n=1 Tax=Paenibacillus sp. NPDC058071 TaxID=3346326 RepID=UPI0036D8AB27